MLSVDGYYTFLIKNVQFSMTILPAFAGIFLSSRNWRAQLLWKLLVLTVNACSFLASWLNKTVKFYCWCIKG